MIFFYLTVLLESAATAAFPLASSDPRCSAAAFQQWLEETVWKTLEWKKPEIVNIGNKINNTNQAI